jgi:transposase
MQVRGAPLIGVTAADGLAIAMRAEPSDANLDASCAVLAAARPTAVNLQWATDSMRDHLLQTVWKVGLCGFLCRAWRARIAHDTHFRIRTFATFVVAEAVDDYVVADNPVRFIDAAGFNHVEAKATGRPGCAPVDLLKLYIYGYLNRVRSSRRLEMDCHRNIDVIWLLRGLKPDFKTIADFRRDNRAAFRSVFRQFVRLCRRLDLYGRELLTVDGTRIKAVNNKASRFDRLDCEFHR